MAHRGSIYRAGHVFFEARALEGLATSSGRSMDLGERVCGGEGRSASLGSMVWVPTGGLRTNGTRDIGHMQAYCIRLCHSKSMVILAARSGTTGSTLYSSGPWQRPVTSLPFRTWEGPFRSADRKRASGPPSSHFCHRRDGGPGTPVTGNSTSIIAPVHAPDWDDRRSRVEPALNVGDHPHIFTRTSHRCRLHTTSSTDMSGEDALHGSRGGPGTLKRQSGAYRRFDRKMPTGACSGDTSEAPDEVNLLEASGNDRSERSLLGES